MPLASIKLDASGHTIIDHADSSTVRLDPSGNLYQEPKEEAAKTETTPTQETSEAPKNPDAEARKLFLEAQKVKRKADADAKKAKDSLSKADAFDKAVSLANSGEDPTAILKAAGIDPMKFYQNLTTHALKPESRPLSPEEQRIKDKEEKLDKYLNELQKEREEMTNEKFNQTHSANIQNMVVPILEKNPDKYESLLSQYGANTAVEIYSAVLDRYKLDGTLVPIEQAADTMEKYWSDIHEAGINKASTMKKFKNRFQTAPNNSSNDNTSEQFETPRSTTLTNNKVTIAPHNPYRKQDRALTGDEKAAAVLRKFGG